MKYLLSVNQVLNSALALNVVVAGIVAFLLVPGFLVNVPAKHSEGLVEYGNFMVSNQMLAHLLLFLLVMGVYNVFLKRGLQRLAGKSVLRG